MTGQHELLKRWRELQRRHVADSAGFINDIRSEVAELHRRVALDELASALRLVVQYEPQTQLRVIQLLKTELQREVLQQPADSPAILQLRQTRRELEAEVRKMEEASDDLCRSQEEHAALVKQVRELEADRKRWQSSVGQ